jgi:hypothetical protein
MYDSKNIAKFSSNFTILEYFKILEKIVHEWD